MKLYLMQLAIMYPSGSPVPGYLIQTDDGVNVLVDTGLPFSYIENPPQLPDRRVEMRTEDYVVNQLARLGLQPEDIHYLVCTHFDADHNGNHEVFSTAELIVQREQYEVARAGHPRFAGSRQHWDHPALRYRLIEGDLELLPGVELIASSGHVPGHQSVLLRLPVSGPVLLAIDAIPERSMLDPETRVVRQIDLDEAGTRASTRKLVELAHREGVGLIVHGHDPAQWPTLKHAPEYYA